MAPQLSTFQQAREFAHTLSPAIGPGMESFGAFDCDGDGLFERYFPYFEYRCDPDLLARIELEFREYAALSGVKVKIGGEWWGVDDYNITCEPVSPHTAPYPQFFMRWLADPRRPESCGALEHFECRFALDDFVFYNFEGAAELRHGAGENGAAAPASLRGLAEFGGRPVLWRMDAALKAGEILEASRLGEFLAAVPRR